MYAKGIIHNREWFFPQQTIFASLLLLLFIRPVTNASESDNLIAVIDLTRGGEVSSSTTDSICDIICQSISEDTFYELFDRTFLPFTFQSLGLPEHPRCSEIPCLVDLGAKIGARYIIGGSIQRVKAGFFLRLTLVNTESKEPVGTVSKVVKNTPKASLHQKILPVAGELLSLNKNQERPKTTVYANAKKFSSTTLTKASTDAADNRQANTLSSAAEIEAKNTEPMQPQNQIKITDTNKKPRMESKESSAAVSEQKKKSNSLPVRIGASAVVVGAAAVVYYFKFMEGSSSIGDDFISLDDAPNHGR